MPDVPDVPDTRPYLTPQDVGERMMVSPVTVRGWARRGLLQAEVTPGGHRRFRREEVERLARQRQAAPVREERRILIVDDDATDAAFMSLQLRSGADPVRVECAGDSFDAGRWLQRLVPDVVLLDLAMPGIDLSRALRCIRATPGCDRTRVIGLVVQSTAAHTAELLASGADAVLAKPLDAVRLLQEVGRSASAA